MEIKAIGKVQVDKKCRVQALALIGPHSTIETRVMGRPSVGDATGGLRYGFARISLGEISAVNTSARRVMEMRLSSCRFSVA